MKRMMQWALLALIAVSAAGCKDDDDRGSRQASPTEARNLFVEAVMTDFYRWADEAQDEIIAKRLDFQTQADPFDYFDELVYPHDRWSGLTDDYAGMVGDFSGTSGTFGYELRLGRLGDEGDLFAVVAYVFPDSPAEEAGMRRGDMIVGINGGAITENNVNDLYNRPTNELAMGRFDVEEGWVEMTGETIRLTARTMYQDPIQHAEVLEEHGHKIGYLCYTQFIADPANDAHGDLVAVFRNFKSAGVEDVVLDLRYNGGGHAVTSDLLSNILAPQSALDKGDVMILERWNDEYGKDQNLSTTFGYEVKYRWNDGKTYTDDVVNMDLDRVYILTSANTASASESVIVGLMPYMDVVLIGETTHGKFCGGQLVDRTVFATKEIAAIDSAIGRIWENALNNWGAYVMVYDFTNKDGDTFENGFAPRTENRFREDILRAAYPFGDSRDPLLGRALELITGEPYNTPETRSHAAESRYNMLPADKQPARNALDGKLIARPRPEIFGR